MVLCLLPGPAAAEHLHPAPIYRAPVEPVAITRLFERPAERWLAGHRGIDLASAVGAAVHTPGEGRVAFTGWVVDRSVVTIVHPNGLRTSLEPVEAMVDVGDWVGRGQQIGVVEDSRSHCAPRACVHWGLRHGDDYLNPLDWLEGFGPVRLLPLDAAS